ncbi:carbon-nitrogen hydrolase [Lipomyces japonicus]|uniref:carbon-nitrogen hydrolase n=1 Tax=Lipomyces japonicus TaxID=56871 RepID=UPI0034CF80CB
MTLAAAGQMCSTSSISNSLEQAKFLIRKSVESCAKVLFLPEASDYIVSTTQESIGLAKPIDRSAFVLGIQRELQIQALRRKSIHVCVGVHEAVPHEDRVKNVLLWIDPGGKIIHKYQKLHMFDVNIKNGPSLMESKSVQPGNEVVKPFESPIGLVGPAICYDIRFPEHALRLRTLGAEIITYPSAFTVKTGQAHWELLGRARAVDTQTYVIMPAQVGMHADTRQSWGHSMIIDPWGTVVAQCSSIDFEPRICVADIDLDALHKVRNAMPLWSQRRGKQVFGYNV